MADTQPPPYPGFNSYVTASAGPYPQQYPPSYPAEQYPYAGHQVPGQQYPFPGQQVPGQQYPVTGQQVPGQQYPFPGQQMPGQQYPSDGQQMRGQQSPYPKQQMPAQQYPYPGQQYPFPGQPYPSPQGTEQPNASNYGPPPVHVPPTEFVFKAEVPGWTGFTDKAIRAVFVRKVYSIMMLQLLFTLAVIALFVFEKNTNLFVRRHRYLYFISYVIFLGVYIALVCCGNLRRKYPTNIILLSIFTISMSYMLGTISSFHNTRIVLMAVGICAGVCLAVTLFSFHTKFDFTSCGGVLMIMVWVLFLFGILAIFTRDQILTTVYAGAGAMLFVLFLAYDTQMLMGGKKHELNPEEHIYAAMQLYLDVAYIFMFLLLALGSGSKD